MSNFIAAFGSFLPRLPLFLVCIAGIVLALTNWNIYRKPALLVLSASAALLLGIVLGFMIHLIAMNHANSERSPTEMANIFAVLGIFQGLLSAVGYGFLLTAAFIGRNHPLPPRA
jgi:hypothetical protein